MTTKSKLKIKWKVSEKPTGSYASFHFRSWPIAFFKKSDKCAINIHCADSYEPWRVKENKHAPLTVYIAQHVDGTFHWRKLKNRFATLDEAKAAGVRALGAHPDFWPKEEKKQDES
jgi:hypothetical protein